MEKIDLINLENKVKNIADPSARKTFLKSVFADLMGYRASEDINDSMERSPYLVQCLDESLSNERYFIEISSKLLEIHDLRGLSVILHDSYFSFSKIEIDPREGYTAENRTSALDRLMRVDQRIVLLPLSEGNVIQVQYNYDKEPVILISPDKISAENAKKNYSVVNFRSSSRDIAFSKELARDILLSDNLPDCYTSVGDKKSFVEALEIAYSKLV